VTVLCICCLCRYWSAFIWGRLACWSIKTGIEAHERCF